MKARLYSRGYHPAPAELAELRAAITRRDGAAFLHRAAGSPPSTATTRGAGTSPRSPAT